MSHNVAEVLQIVPYAVEQNEYKGGLLQLIVFCTDAH